MKTLNDSVTEKQKKCFEYIKSIYTVNSIQYLTRGKIRVHLESGAHISVFKNGKMYHAYRPGMPAVVKEIVIGG